MTYDYLYRKEDGITFAYSKERAEGHKDLIAITKEEVLLLRKMTIAEVLNERAKSTGAGMDAHVKVNVKREFTAEEVDELMHRKGGKKRTDEEAAAINKRRAEERVFNKPRGVRIVKGDGKPQNFKNILKAAVASAPKEDPFGNVEKSYKEYWGYVAPVFPAEKLAEVPNEDLVRFAEEALHLELEPPQEGSTEEEVEAYYDYMRKRITKELGKEKRKRNKRVAMSGNDAEVCDD